MGQDAQASLHLFRRSSPPGYQPSHDAIKILKGAKPGELAVEQVTEFELVINRASSEG